MRVGVNGNALAFKNPDGGLVATIFNESQQPRQTRVSVGGHMLQFQIPARGWATVNVQAN